jgi:prepilin-type processing-associated H-X9-DG protein
MYFLIYNFRSQHEHKHCKVDKLFYTVTLFSNFLFYDGSVLEWKHVAQ